MRDIWIVSDTHFMHKNILTFRDDKGELIRGKRFSDVQDMDETMIENWNSVVKPGDLVYHLGDVMMGPKEEFAKMWPRLAGSKRLIVGNHDDIKYLSAGSFFKKVQMWRMFPDMGLLLTHVPIHESGLRRHDGGRMLRNVHGHIHHNLSPTEHHVNVSVEAINYTPINIEELRKW